MKIELTKEITISIGIGNTDPGVEVIWHWVRVYDGENKVISECFYSEEKAKAYYTGLIECYKKYSSFKPAPEVLLSETI